MLVVKFDTKGEPSAVELDGRPIFVNKLDVQYRPCEPAKVIMEMYLQDEGGILQRHDGDPLTEERVLYAVSKEDFELLQRVKAGPGWK